MLGSRRGRNSQLYALNSRCEIDRPHLLGRNSRTQREERKADITKEAHLTCASTKMYSHHDCTMEPRFDQREAFRANHRPTGPNVSQITPTSELATNLSRSERLSGFRSFKSYSLSHLGR